MSQGTFYTLQYQDGERWLDYDQLGSYSSFEEASATGLVWALERSLNIRVVRTTVDISQRAYAPVAQCSWGAGGDPASGCESVAVWQGLCRVHKRAAEILDSHYTVEEVNGEEK